jgi:hypothetical protein
MTTLKGSILKLQAGSFQVQVSEGGAIVGEGKKRCTYIVPKSGQSEFLGP